VRKNVRLRLTVKRGFANLVVHRCLSKDKLDISDSEGKIKKEVKNSTASIVECIVKKIAKPGETFVVCEATGGYERTLVKAMQAAGAAVCIANPFQVRQFARGIGVLEKSDPIDAGMRRQFGEMVDLQPTAPKSAERERHEALIRRREQLLTLISMEQNRRAQSYDPTVTAMIDKILTTASLQNQIITQKEIQIEHRRHTSKNLGGLGAGPQLVWQDILPCSITPCTKKEFKIALF